MTTLGSSVQTLGNLLHTHDLYDHLRAVPPAIAPYADPLNFCSPRIAALSHSHCRDGPVDEILQATSPRVSRLSHRAHARSLCASTTPGR